MEVRPEDVKSFFEGQFWVMREDELLLKSPQGFGTMTDCRILTGFGFIEFETEKVSRACHRR